MCNLYKLSIKSQDPFKILKNQQNVTHIDVVHRHCDILSCKYLISYSDGSIDLINNEE